jgi:hypothetical protein
LCSYLMNLSLSLLLSVSHTFIPPMLNPPSPSSQRQLYPWSCQIVYYLEPIKEETFKNIQVNDQEFWFLCSYALQITCCVIDHKVQFPISIDHRECKWKRR